jgi:hypothetical protein
MLCLGMHSIVMLRFIVQALVDCRIHRYEQHPNYAASMKQSERKRSLFIETSLIFSSLVLVFEHFLFLFLQS